MPLLADEDIAVSKAYGVTGWLGPLASLTELKGETVDGRYVKRAIFVIDGEGVVRYRHVSTTGVELPVGRRPRAGCGGDRLMPAEPAALRGRRGRRADDPGRAGGGGAAGRPLPRDHGDARLGRSTAPGRWSAPGTRSSPTTRAATASPTRAPPGGGLCIPGARRRPGGGRRGPGGGGPLRPRRPLDGRPHGGCLRAGASRAGRGAGRRSGRSTTARSRPSRSSTGTASRRRSRRAASTGSSTTSTASRGSTPPGATRCMRFTRERMLRHRHLDAVAEALRQVPRSRPFELARRARAARGPDPGRRQRRRRRSRASLRDGGGVRAAAAARGAGQRGRGAVAAGLAGGTALARDRPLLRRQLAEGARMTA